LETKVVRIENPEIQHEEIEEAAKLIRSGQVVAFPTETVYGLGANALDENAVQRIFLAKGRPSDNPLIVHISRLEDVERLAAEIPPKAVKAMEAFWPGPLTVILKKTEIVPFGVTAGLNTVGIRMPKNAIARSLIEASGVPIAAPSANLSGRPSPTTAEHVLADMKGRIPMLIDGGKCEVGLESTVLDMTSEVPVILRPGGVTLESLWKLLGRVEVDPGVLSPIKGDGKVKSPGMKYTHYAPRASVVIIRGDREKQIREIQRMAKNYVEEGKRVGILATEETKACYRDGQVLVLGSRVKPATLAANLFMKLREFDDLKVDIILAEGVEAAEEGLAVMNRMIRAAGFHVIDV